MKRRFSHLVALALFCQVLFAQQQVVLTPTKDNTLYQTTDGSLSDGSGDYLFAGRVGSSGGGAIRRALLKFDLPGTIPPAATITSVKLTMNMSKTNAGPQSISLQKVASDWGEGTSNANSNEGSGAASSTSDATWVQRFYPSTSWTRAGGDFTATVSASTQVSDAGSYSWGSTSQMVADVQGWLTNPSSNFGWILIGNESTTTTTKRFDSRENSASANRPKLIVTYIVATAVSQISLVPTETALEQNFPNPFNPTTRLRFAISEPGFVQMSVFDVLGREVADPVHQSMTAGQYTVTFNASGLASGVYFYRLQAGHFVDVKRMFVLK